MHSKTKIAGIAPSFKKIKNVPKLQKSLVKCHHYYNHKYTIDKERERLREPEKQYSEHAASADSKKPN